MKKSTDRREKTEHERDVEQELLTKLMDEYKKQGESDFDALCNIMLFAMINLQAKYTHDTFNTAITVSYVLRRANEALQNDEYTLNDV